MEYAPTALEIEPEYAIYLNLILSFLGHSALHPFKVVQYTVAKRDAKSGILRLLLQEKKLQES